mmetsp:Transcript_100930/g.323970  ORF Transcript_100930/g.323970 Transcript_100930/m.323970 type:complete len:277 (+) Transcript_100930:247-1077(+)
MEAEVSTRRTSAADSDGVAWPPRLRRFDRLGCESREAESAGTARAAVAPSPLRARPGPVGAAHDHLASIRHTVSRAWFDEVSSSAPVVATASRSATPMLPSPEGLSKTRKAVARGSTWRPNVSEQTSGTATHSAQSMAPLPSKSRLDARSTSWSSGTSPLDSNSAFMPSTNSCKSSLPSSSESRAKKRSYHGIEGLSRMSSASEVICAQTVRTSCWKASRLAKRESSDNAPGACRTRSTRLTSCRARGETKRLDKAREEARSGTRLMSAGTCSNHG